MGILHRLTAVLFLAATPVFADCEADRVDIRGDFGTIGFRVELAVTPAEQTRGLMFREEMARLAGMLFIYPEAQETAFWMRNTLIPLDMIFIEADGRILKIHENAIPGDETPIRSDGPSIAVLEINGGLAREFGIEVGDEVRNPALPQDGALWPCP